MQQIDAHQQEPEPVIVQQDMHFSEDSLADTDSEQAASEVTCTEYFKQIETEYVSHDCIEMPGH